MTDQRRDAIIRAPGRILPPPSPSAPQPTAGPHSGRVPPYTQPFGACCFSFAPKVYVL